MTRGVELKKTWPNLLALILLSGAVLFSALSLVGVLVGVEPWRTLFAVTSEQNLPTWYAVLAILIAAAIALTTGLLSRAGDRAMARRWYAVGGLLVLLSVDEAASLHERLQGIGSALVSGGGLLHFAWVVPGIVIAALILVAVVSLSRSLPRPIAVELLIGFGIFLAAAVGLEMVGGLVLSTIGDGWTYVLTATVEEFAETLGVVLIAHAAARTITVDRRADGSIRLSHGWDTAVGTLGRKSPERADESLADQAPADQPPAEPSLADQSPAEDVRAGRGAWRRSA